MVNKEKDYFHTLFI